MPSKTFVLFTVVLRVYPVALCSAHSRTPSACSAAVNAKRQSGSECNADLSLHWFGALSWACAAAASGQPCPHTYRRGCAIHSLCSYNADFDGDEINVHFPQVCPIGSGVLGVLGEWFVHE